MQLPEVSLLPLAEVRSIDDIQKVLSHSLIQEIYSFEQKLGLSHKKTFSYLAECAVCQKDSYFQVKKSSPTQMPNWRESLFCQMCNMTNKQRLITHKASKLIQNYNYENIYITESVSPINLKLEELFPQKKIISQSYLGYEYENESYYNNIQHFDLKNSSFEKESFDIIISNDLIDQVPGPNLVFKEFYRLLTSHGTFLSLLPFHFGNQKSQTRASLQGKKITHIQEPIIPGNIINRNGSLIFTEFGWDIIDMLKNVGFIDIRFEVYNSARYGHLGVPQLLLLATK